MTRNVSIDCSVYGGYDGAAAFLDTPEGVIPPPYIAHMTYLGSPADVVNIALCHLLRRQGGKKRPGVQQSLADLLNTFQQDVSRWSNGQCAPRLDDADWAVLIRFVIEANEAKAS